MKFHVESKVEELSSQREQDPDGNKFLYNFDLPLPSASSRRSIVKLPPLARSYSMQKKT